MERKAARLQVTNVNALRLGADGIRHVHDERDEESDSHVMGKYFLETRRHEGKKYAEQKTESQRRNAQMHQVPHGFRIVVCVIDGLVVCHKDLQGMILE